MTSASEMKVNYFVQEKPEWCFPLKYDIIFFNFYLYIFCQKK